LRNHAVGRWSSQDSSPHAFYAIAFIASVTTPAQPLELSHQRDSAMQDHAAIAPTFSARFLGAETLIQANSTESYGGGREECEATPVFEKSSR
jgi:hypothetical protein